MRTLTNRLLSGPVLILLIGGGLILAVATLKPAPEPQPVEPPAPPVVSVIEARPKTVTLTIHSQGTVAPRREIDLIAEVSGRITDTADHFVSGAFVQQGQTLLQIDPRDYELARTNALASVAEAEQLLATERGRSQQAQREWRDLGDLAANELFLRKPQLAAAEAQLQSARAELSKAELNLERTRISVPFDARIRETLVNLGQYVAPGTPLASVYDTRVAEVRLPLTDRQAGLIDLPLGFNSTDPEAAPQVTIHGVIGGESYRWEGRITRTDASVDTRTRFYYAIAEVEQPFRSDPESGRPPLLIGLFVEAEIYGRELSDVIVLPRQALFKQDHIYTLDEDNRVQEKAIRLLRTDASHAWIKGDLEPGEAIVVGKQTYLSNGLIVTPQPFDESDSLPGVRP